jgi:hypothetical protein
MVDDGGVGTGIGLLTLDAWSEGRRMRAKTEALEDGLIYGFASAGQ